MRLAFFFVKEASGGVLFFDVGVFYGGWLTRRCKDLTDSSVDLYLSRNFVGKTPPRQARHDGLNGDDQSRGGGGNLAKIKPAFYKQLG